MGVFYYYSSYPPPALSEHSQFSAWCKLPINGLRPQAIFFQTFFFFYTKVWLHQKENSLPFEGGSHKKG